MESTHAARRKLEIFRDAAYNSSAATQRRNAARVYNWRFRRAAATQVDADQHGHSATQRDADWRFRDAARRRLKISRRSATPTEDFATQRDAD